MVYGTLLGRANTAPTVSICISYLNQLLSAKICRSASSAYHLLTLCQFIKMYKLYKYSEMEPIIAYLCKNRLVFGAFSLFFLGDSALSTRQIGDGERCRRSACRRRIAVRQLTDNCRSTVWAAVRHGSDSCLSVVRLLSDTCRMAIGLLIDCFLTIVPLRTSGECPVFDS